MTFTVNNQEPDRQREHLENTRRAQDIIHAFTTEWGTGEELSLRLALRIAELERISNRGE